MTLLYLILFLLIGMGPTLAIRRQGVRDLVAWLIAPTIGLILMTIFVTLLVVMQQPIIRFARVLAIVAIVISLGLLAWELFVARRTVTTAPAQGEARWGAAAVLTTTLLVALPVQMGGFWFNHFRGNAWDSYNYVSTAGALVHEPLNWLRNSDIDTLLARHSAYGHASRSLADRWSTSALLGWLATLTASRLFVVEPHYGAMHLLLAAGPAFLLARRLGAGPRWAFVTAIVVTCGFWAQFSLDLRALSQLNAFPVLLLLLAIWPEAAAAPRWNPFTGPRLLVLLAILGLSLLYAELLVMTILGLAIYAGASLAWKQVRLSQLAQMALPVVLGSLAAVATVPWLSSFLGRQVYAVTAKTDRSGWIWTQHYWLATAPLTGFWGLTHMDASIPGWWSMPVLILAIVLACAISTLLLWELVSVFASRQATSSDRVMGAMIVAGVVQAGGMLLLGQGWAAEKGAGYVAPLCLLGAVAWWASRGHRLKVVPQLHAVFAVAVSLFVLSQCWVAILRPMLIARRSDYLNYMFHLSHYAARDLDPEPLRAGLPPPGQHDVIVGSMVSDPWMSRMLRLDLGWDYSFFEPLGAFDVDYGKYWHVPTPAGKIDYWILPKQSVLADMPKEAIKAQTPEFVVVASMPFIIDAEPNAVERDPANGQQLIWIGNHFDTIRINAPADGSMALVGQFLAGPSLTGTSQRRVEVANDAAGFDQELTVNESTNSLNFPVKAGVNNIRIKCNDQPNVSEMANGDTRALLLRINSPHLLFQAK